MKRAIVMTGLPASGKTTLGRRIAQALGCGFLDKDDFLERLYDRHHVPGWEARRALSRKADALFCTAAIDGPDLQVLVSHWQPATGGDSGTPTGWIADTFTHVAEICCQCPPDIALERFQNRTRHPGHLDDQRDPEALLRRFHNWAAAYPLGLGHLIDISPEASPGWPALQSALDTWLSAPSN